jgi:hypothetical protein
MTRPSEIRDNICAKGSSAQCGELSQRGNCAAWITRIGRRSCTKTRGLELSEIRRPSEAVSNRDKSALRVRRHQHPSWVSGQLEPKRQIMAEAVLSQVTVRDLGQSKLSGAGALVGRAMHDNPVMQRLFERCFSRRAAAIGEIYGTVLRQIQAKGVVLGAFTADDALVGVGAMVQPGRCAQSAFERLALSRVVQSCTSVEMALAHQRWQSALGRRDPKDQHWHVGPVAIEPGFQRKGFGTALMAAIGARIDKFPAMAYLETDRRESVPFFARSGFKAIADAGVMEVPHWFMMRPRQR